MSNLKIELQTHVARRIIVKLEEAVSDLRNGFYDEEDYKETGKTLARLDMETNELLNDLKEKTDGQNI